MLGALQFTPSTPHAVQSHDLFSVTLRYGVAGASMTAPLVQGSPYVTVDYAGLRPMLVLVPGTFNWTAGNMVAASNLTGPLRVANAPTPADLAILDAHAGAVPRGAALSVTTAWDDGNSRTNTLWWIATRP
jgi:hypothetical protein